MSQAGDTRSSATGSKCLRSATPGLHGLANPRSTEHCTRRCWCHQGVLRRDVRARGDGPGLAQLLAYIREGDTVVVWKLDRLGCNMLHILQTVKELTDRGVTLVSTSDGIDSSTPAGRMMIGVLGSLAEYERELIRERTALKRQASRANGTKFGRPRNVADAEHLANRIGITCSL